jgi:hypothetical protein
MKSSITRTALLALLALLALATLPPQAARAKDEPPPKLKAIRVAVFPIINESPDPGATKIMVDVLRDQLADIDKSRATFIYPADVERILTAHNVMDRVFRINEQWAKSATLDSADVVGLDSLLVVNDILLVKVSEWESVIVHQIGAGQSNTTVGLRFALYNIGTDALVWTKSPREQRFSQEIDPSSSMIGYDGAGTIQNSKAIEAPRFQDVASDLVRNSFKRFPQK